MSTNQQSSMKAAIDRAVGAWPEPTCVIPEWTEPLHDPAIPQRLAGEILAELQMIKRAVRVMGEFLEHYSRMPGWRGAGAFTALNHPDVRAALQERE